MQRRYPLVAVFALALMVQPLGAAGAMLDGVEPTEDLVTRTDAPIEIREGRDTGLLSPTPDDEISVDLSLFEGTAFSPSATYTFGDPTNPVVEPAFTIANTDSKAHDVTVRYTADDTPLLVENVQFHLYDGDGRSRGRLSEESPPVTVSALGSGESIYVIVVLDTRGIPPDTLLTGRLIVSV